MAFDGTYERAGTGIAIFVASDEPIGARIVYVNDAFTRMTGYTSDQLVNHSAMLLAGARPRPEQLDAVQAVPRDGRPYVGVEEKARRDGTRYRAEVRIETLRTEPGRPTHVVLTQRELAPVSVRISGADGAPAVQAVACERHCFSAP